jgi:hypothetical protein
MDPVSAISLIQNLIGAFETTLRIELLPIAGMFAAGSILLAVSTTSLVLAIRGW